MNQNENQNENPTVAGGPDYASEVDDARGQNSPPVDLPVATDTVLPGEPVVVTEDDVDDEDVPQPALDAHDADQEFEDSDGEPDFDAEEQDEEGSA